MGKMVIIMKRFENTYCNPIVLPSYPLLPVLHHGRYDKEDIWQRKGKTFLSEADIMAEAGITDGDVDLLYLDVHHPDDRFVAENDVRATADPSAFYYDGRWYLYCTSGMVYDSDDLVHWTPHYDETWMPISAPMAPTIEEFNGKFYVTANSTPLHVSDSPLGPWKKVGEFTLKDGRETLCNDPMIFADNGHLYLYWGLGICIMGAELDPERPNHFITDPKILIHFNPENWWERFGASNEDWSRGFIEGSWMVKANNKYYLTYSCSGTEYYNYAMGAYVGDSPLGDFTLQARNPVSRSRNGLVKGGGHGSFVKGPKDTLWCFYTIPVCYDCNMERRIGMDPAGIDEDGNLYALTGCDVPQWNPGVLEHPELGNRTELLPLTIFRPITATSYNYGRTPLYATDEALHTWWEPKPDDEVKSFEVNLQGQYYVSSFRLMWKDIGLNFKNGIMPGAYQYKVEMADCENGNKWVTVVDASENTEDLSVDYRTFDEIRTGRVRFTILGAPKGVQPGVLNFTVFGVSASKPRK